MRAAAGAVFCVATLFIVLGLSAASRLWGDYKDSPDSFYIEIAVAFFGLALLAILGAVLLLRADRKQQRIGEGPKTGR